MSECLGFPHFARAALCNSLGRRNDRRDKPRVKLREDLSIRIEQEEKSRIKAVTSLWLEEFDMTQVDASPSSCLHHQHPCITLMFNTAIVTIL
jgi:hypothetical protein